MMIYASIRQMRKMLTNLQTFLDQGVELAGTKEFPVERLLDARLAPDMFNLTRNVQGACDAAKFAASRTAGIEAPRHADDETTLEELRARIDATLEFIDGLDEAAFDGAAERQLELKSLGGLKTTGGKYFVEFAQPNFYFHITTVYAILRHNGVPLGKRVYIGSIDGVS